MSSDESDDLEEGEILSDDDSPTPAKKQCSGNTWSNLAAEDFLQEGFGGMGTSATNDRGAESYNWKLKDKLKEFAKKQRDGVSSSESDVSSSSDGETVEAIPELPETFGFIEEKPGDRPKKAKERLGKKKYYGKRREEIEKLQKSGKDRGKNMKESFGKGNDKGEEMETLDEEKNSEVTSKPDKTEPAAMQSGDYSSLDDAVKRINRKRRWGDYLSNDVKVPTDEQAKPKNPLFEYEHKNMKVVDVNATMEPDLLVDLVLDSLHEPDANRKIIVGIYDALGPDDFIRVYKATQNVEDMGGLMCGQSNASRRRTAGGVFFHLVRQEKKLTAEQLDELFAEGNRMFKKKLKAYKKKEKTWRQAHGMWRQKGNSNTGQQEKKMEGVTEEKSERGEKTGEGEDGEWEDVETLEELAPEADISLQ